MCENFQNFQEAKISDLGEVFVDLHIDPIWTQYCSIYSNFNNFAFLKLYLKDLEEIKICEDSEEFLLRFKKCIDLLFLCKQDQKKVLFQILCQYLEKTGKDKNFCFSVNLTKRSQILNQTKISENKNLKLNFQQLKFLLKNLKKNQIKNFKNFTKIKKIGQGAFGLVYQIYNKQTKMQQALKISSQNQNKELLNEIQFLKKNQSDFIVKYYDSYTTEKNSFLLLEYLNKGDLFDFMRKKILTEKQAQFIIANIILALEVIHENDYVYRDLKPENILITENGYLKLCDFGLSTQITDKKKLQQFCGTPEYVSPEAILGYQISQKSDFWSLGILVYELLLGRLPFYSKDTQKMYKKILLKKLNFKKSVNLSENCLKFLKQILKRNPKNRLGFENGVQDLKNHSWFQDFNWVALKQKFMKSPLIEKTLSFEQSEDIIKSKNQIFYQEVQPCSKKQKLSFSLKSPTGVAEKSKAEVILVQIIFKNYKFYNFYKNYKAHKQK